MKQLIGLLERKESLQAQLAAVDAQLASHASAAPSAPARLKAAPKPAPKPAPKAVPQVKAGRAARGSVKTAIIDLVKAAGAEGITVKDIAAKLRATYNRVYTWFQTTGKNVKEIKKAGPGKFAWAASGAGGAKVVAAPKAKRAAKAAPVAKPAKAKRGKPGVDKDRIIEWIKGAGKGGITVKEVAKRLGIDAQRVYVWFNATGKNVKEVKKVAPATYAWVG